MSTATAEAGPDLSGLDEAMRRRIDVAVARGATWFWYEPNRDWWLEAAPGPPHNAATLLMVGEKGAYETGLLPDPENDPAAAWELMVSERISLYPAFSSDFTDPWEARWGFGDERDFGDAVAGIPGRAVVDAFLAKHARLVS